MKVVNLGENPSVLNNFIAEMRDATIQKDRLRFRTNLERVGRNSLTARKTSLRPSASPASRPATPPS